MVHPLQQRVEAVRRKAAGMRWFVAACRVFAVVVTAIVFVGVADFFVRSPEPVVRWLMTALVVAAAVAAVWRWGWPAAWAGCSQLATARHIEARFPQLRERLSNSIAFATHQENEPWAGSLTLRRAVIAETEALAVHLDFRDALDKQPLWRAGMLAGAAALLFAVVAALFPSATPLALQRLAMPWSDVSWPLHHQLAFVEAPTRLAQGADFEAQVVDRNGPLPQRVQLLIRYYGPSGQRTETLEMKPLGDRMVYRLENVTQPFAYKAIGGDHRTMPWTEVEVLEAPELAEFTLNVQPPKYSGWPNEKLERVARVLAGSQLTITGKTDKPVTSVAIRETGNGATVRKAELSADGRSFVIPPVGEEPWIATKSGAYSFELLDDSGIVGGKETRIELQVVADAPPVIAWETPTDQTFVTPRAVIPVTGLVKDDLAIDRVTLKFLQPGATDENERSLELYAGPAPAEVAKSASGGLRKGDGQAVTIDTVWDLAALGLQPGNVLSVRIEAADFKPQTSTTPVRRISVIDDAEFENRMLQQQTSIFTQLSDAMRLQRESHGQVSALQIQLDETKAMTARDIDQLQGAELLQRQVQRLLGDPSDGVDARLEQMLQSLKHNRVEGNSLGARLAELQTKVRRIRNELLLDIAQQLTTSLKSARAQDTAKERALTPADQAAIVQPLVAAESGQMRVVESLEEILSELSEWDNFSRLAREIGQIRQQQAKLQEETESLRWKIAAAAGEQPTAEQRAAARQLSGRQQDLARRFDKLQGRMDDLRERLETSDPRTATTLSEASDLGRRLAIGGQMRQAGRELTEYRISAGQRTQQRVLEAMGQLLDSLSARRDRELQRTVESLKAVQDELDLLRKEQRQLAALAEAAEAEQDEQQRKRQLMRLAREQDAVAEKTEELRRKLERLQAKRPAKASGEGVASMRRAGQSAEAGDAGSTREQTAEASRLLDETRQQLQQEIEQAQADLVREQLTRLEQSVEALIVRQKNVLAEVERLQAGRSPDDELTPAQQATLAGVAAEQHLLAEEVEQLRSKLTTAAAFSLALDGVRQEMLRAAGLLAERRTDEAVARAAQNALDRLEQMLRALKEGDSAAPPQDQQQDNGGDADQADGESLVRSIAELKLLAELQAVINRRTAEIESERQKNGGLTADQQNELESLAAEQGRLAEMVIELAGLAESADEGLPKLPPIEPDGAKEPGTKPSPTPSLDEQLLRDLLETP